VKEVQAVAKDGFVVSLNPQTLLRVHSPETPLQLLKYLFLRHCFCHRTAPICEPN
jgi:hypothetical protein